MTRQTRRNVMLYVRYIVYTVILCLFNHTLGSSFFVISLINSWQGFGHLLNSLQVTQPFLFQGVTVQDVSKN